MIDYEKSNNRTTLVGINMYENSIFPKSWTFEIQVLKLVVGQQIINNFKLNGQLSLDEMKIQYARREGSINFVLAWCEKLRVMD